eukprot:TRINITY_DN92_c0_g4_i1.p1 TRINITY_DN92_c0_g4~~TRINITY_DN92_c0_g4_i1.p1  ORF type:complete len:128 (-),score=19.73 TRINITY_DN92_c0_g4_i1:118-501(-)
MKTSIVYICLFLAFVCSINTQSSRNCCYEVCQRSCDDFLRSLWAPGGYLCSTQREQCICTNIFDNIPEICNGNIVNNLAPTDCSICDSIPDNTILCRNSAQKQFLMCNDPSNRFENEFCSHVQFFST